MNKKLGASLGGLVVVGLGVWLGGTAYSSYMFDEQLNAQIQRINAETPQLDLEAADVERGFFSSTGTLSARTKGESDQPPLTVTAPYTAHHGLLSTEVEGTLDAKTEGDTPYVFSTLLAGGDKARFHSTFSHLDQGATLTLDVPDLKADTGAQHMSLDGLSIEANLDQKQWHVDGSFGALGYRDFSGELTLGNTHFDATQEGRPAVMERRVNMTINDARLSAEQLMPVTVKTTQLASRLTHHDKMLDQTVQAELTDMSTAGQRLGNLTMNSSLSDVNADGWYGAKALLDQHPEWAQGDVDARALRDLTPSVLKALSSSPTWTLSTLRFEGPLFNKPITAEGTVDFDGNDVQSLPADALATDVGQRALLERVKGKLTLNNAPPIISLIVGAPDQSKLVFKLSDRTLYVNDREFTRLGD
ncbi:DUF945 family protein [Larsenimonas salina]|uniref:DUF945 family protein n=1 Tax=Larsenimonas salina TaxID=1295565 RepID=UPI0020745728|nr:DUF945 family protein [Larsenimonas salina]MCM5704900.1 YdgA family protein [Larsenimonas salina]